MCNLSREQRNWNGPAPRAVAVASGLATSDLAHYFSGSEAPAAKITIQSTLRP